MDYSMKDLMNGASLIQKSVFGKKSEYQLKFEVKGINGFNKKIWICPVTLFVLGKYPAYIYIKKTV